MAFAIDDRILLGEGLFETLKVEDGKPCWAYMHWQRLSNSAHLLNIVFTLSFNEWLALLQEKIAQEALMQGGIKVILSGGSAPRGLTAQGQGNVVQLQTFPCSAPLNPVRLMTAPWKRDAANPLYQFKSVNYLEAILARRHALSAGADDALFFNLKAHATETTCANLFIIHQNELFTPALADGILPGITRARVIALANKHNINCFECSVTESMIAEADALFLTNALQGIHNVGALNSRSLVTNHPLSEHLRLALDAEKEI